ncbi:MAG: glycosyl hydrolase 108 family protein [Burkholderiaceae bacterium]
MPSAALENALKFVLRWEGGFVDRPDDPGGRTNKGITQKVYDGWRARQGQPARDVKLIEDDEVGTIYQVEYWLPPRCDLLMSPLELVQFDTAVNMGVGRAVRFLQTALACPTDGDFGPGTERAVRQCDSGSVVVDYCRLREQFYRDLVQNNPKLAVFLKGWMNRLDSLRREAGLPGFESAEDPIDFGDAPFIARVPDIGEDARYD